jgi:site-specific recombinase XerD
MNVRLSARAGTVQIRDGKGHKARAASLNTTARQTVKAYVETLPAVTAQTPVFLSKRGTPLAVRSFLGSWAHNLLLGSPMGITEFFSFRFFHFKR